MAIYAKNRALFGLCFSGFNYASSFSGIMLLINSITILKIASIFAKISVTMSIVAPPFDDL